MAKDILEVVARWASDNFQKTQTKCLAVARRFWVIFTKVASRTHVGKAVHARACYAQSNNLQNNNNNNNFKVVDLLFMLMVEKISTWMSFERAIFGSSPGLTHTWPRCSACNVQLWPALLSPPSFLLWCAAPRVQTYCYESCSLKKKQKNKFSKLISLFTTLDARLGNYQVYVISCKSAYATCPRKNYKFIRVFG